MTTPLVQHLRSKVPGARPGDGTIRALMDGEVFVQQSDAVLSFPRANGARADYYLDNLADVTKPNTWVGPQVVPIAPSTTNDGTAASMRSCRNLLTYVTPEMFGAAGDGVTDDRAAFTLALAFLASTASVKLMKTTRMAYLIAGAGQLVVPSAVTVASEYSYVGADGANLPQIIFTDPSAGLYVSNYTSLKGMRVSCNGGNTAVPNIEYCGQVGIYNVRTDGNSANGIACTRVINAQSSVDLSVAPSGGAALTNGTYANVAFTGGGSTGARVNVTVASGAISAITFSAYGVVTNPSFVLGFAAGALYSGSPAIAQAGFAITGQSGRSRFADIWNIGHTNIGCEIDCAYDFCNAYNIHVWNPGAAVAKALRIGKTDGLTIVGFKSFNSSSYGMSFENPYPTGYSFATVEGTEIDLANYGIGITGPMQIDFKGGYVRSVGRCFNIASAISQIGINMNLLCISDHHIVATAWGLLNIAGCNFNRGTYLAGGYNVYLSNTGGGACQTLVEANNTDGNGHFGYLAGAISGTIGKNNWWPTVAGLMYVNNANSSPQTITLSKIRQGQFNGTTDSSGRFYIPHTLGTAPTVPRAELVGASAANGNRSVIVSNDATNITCQVLTPAGANVASGISVAAYWEA